LPQITNIMHPHQQAKAAVRTKKNKNNYKKNIKILNRKARKTVADFSIL